MFPDDLQRNELLKVVNDRLLAAVTRERQIAQADAGDTVDRGPVRQLLGGMQDGFFQVTPMTEGGNNRGSHAIFILGFQIVQYLRQTEDEIGRLNRLPR